VGGLYNMYHGLHSLLVSPHIVTDFHWAFGVIFLSFLLEGSSLFNSTRSIRNLARLSDLTFLQYLKQGSETPAIAVFFEDSFAIGGLGLASLALTLTYHFGTTFFDAIGQIAIGTGLAVAAWTLGMKNVNLLVGKSFSTQRVKRLVDIIKLHPCVDYILDVKTYDSGSGRFKAEIVFNGREIVRTLVESKPELLEHWTKLAYLQSNEEKIKFLGGFGDYIIQQCGVVVDEIEHKMKEIEPGLHVDLETHATLIPRSAKSSTTTTTATSSMKFGSNYYVSRGSDITGEEAVKVAQRVNEFDDFITHLEANIKNSTEKNSNTTNNNDPNKPKPK